MKLYFFTVTMIERKNLVQHQMCSHVAREKIFVVHMHTHRQENMTKVDVCVDVFL